MSIKHALLGLLAQAPRHGYELKNAFEEQVGTLWHLNIGQVYNTLRILERGSLVVLHSQEQEGRGPARKVYAITEAGQQELARWIAEPVRQPRRLKDEFYVKLVFTRLNRGDVSALIWRQRQAYLQVLHQINALRAKVNPEADAFEALLLEGGAFHLEADLKWLDRCEDLLG